MKKYSKNKNNSKKIRDDILTHIEKLILPDLKQRFLDLEEEINAIFSNMSLENNINNYYLDLFLSEILVVKICKFFELSTKEIYVEKYLYTYHNQKIQQKQVRKRTEWISHNPTSVLEKLNKNNFLSGWQEFSNEIQEPFVKIIDMALYRNELIHEEKRPNKNKKIYNDKDEVFKILLEYIKFLKFIKEILKNKKNYTYKHKK